MASVHKMKTNYTRNISYELLSELGAMLIKIKLAHTLLLGKVFISTTNSASSGAISKQNVRASLLHFFAL